LREQEGAVLGEMLAVLGMALSVMLLGQIWKAT
jgi:hypothetical protein